jgi:heme-degrading monooxygenase HmoA
MIARSWSARATADGARAYAAYFERTLEPQLRELDGYRGALVMTRAHGDGVEVQVLTVWASMAAVARFAPDPALAVVEPEARELLISFDERVSHLDIALDARPAVELP